MVLISPPLEALPQESAGNKGQMAVGDSMVDSQAETQDGFPAFDTQPLETRSDAPKWVDPRESLAPTSSLELPTAAHAGTGSEAVPLPPPGWQSASSARTRHLLAISAIGLVGFAVSAAVFALIVKQWKQSRSSVAQNVVQPDASHNQPPEETNPAEEANPPEETTIVTENPPEPDAALETNTTGDEPSSAAPTEDPTDSGTPSTIPSTDDAELFPEPPQNTSQGDPAAAPVVDNMGPSELPAGLGQYIQVLELNRPAAIQPKNPRAPTPAITELRIQDPQISVPETEYPPPAPAVDIRQRIRVRVLGFVADAQPLDKVLRVIEQTAGVPLEMDLLAFDIAGMKPDLPISVRVDSDRIADLNVQTLLQGILKLAQCRMTPSENEHFIQILPLGDKIEAGLAKALSLADFQNQIPIATDDFVRLLGTFESPVKISLNPNQDGLLVEGTMAARVRAALVLESLRRARKMPLALGDEFAERWVVDTSASDGTGASPVDWDPLPATPVGLDFNQPRSTEWIIGDLARESQAAMVVNWSSAWSHGFTTDASSLPWLKGRTAAQVCQEVLEPYALNVYAAGQGVWWLGTQEAYDLLDIVAILPEAKGEPSQLLEQMATATAIPIEQFPGTIDPESNRIVVRLPRFVVRQLHQLLSK